MERPPARDRMVEWVLFKGADPNAKNDRGDTAYQLAARVGIASTLDLLVKTGAKEVKEEWPKPAAGASSAEAAVKKSIPLIEISREAGVQSLHSGSWHSNSLPATSVGTAANTGFHVTT